MSPAILALIMLAIIVLFILFEKQLKVPMNFVLFTVPVIFSFLMGYDLTQTSTFILTQLSTVMNQTGYMLLFGLIYFVMLTETGMFDVMVNAVMKRIGNRLNVIGVMILTSVLGAIAYLTANMSTTYLIVFPIVIPLYKKFKIDRDFAFIICQTAVAAMCWLPWGIGVIMSATMAGTNAETLAQASIPWGVCFIPAIILQYVYFAWRHKKEHGSLGLPKDTQVQESENQATQEKEFARHDLFWINFLIFILVVVALAVFKVPSYLVFIAASMVTALINYPKNFGQIWNKAGMTFFNVLIMLLAICFYLAIFNAAPEDGSKLSMVASLAQLLESIFPAFLLNYMHIVFLLLAVPIIYFVPYQLYNALYPLFISVGAAFGLSPIAIIAPFVCNLALATSVTPMNSATFVGCSLIEREVGPYTRQAAPIMFVTNLIVVLTALLTGVLQF
ncbi:SLC13 family permease [Streptococcus oriscaviae]|uniref:Citrate:H+ symporter n=1 Tax=Streptococcus oriscaviae TaxID=2781599 RepID=A0ABX7YM63_9STRE|nr:SLC13 family permease [Streptococcus oriscaviae]QUE54419.1 citrate:H+ symporter [Streptococcus oriscaviae]